MKHCILALTAILLGGQLFAQGFTQSAEGKSTLLFKGTGIGIDITQANINVDVNNMTQKVLAASEARAIYGINVKAKNEEGIGGLFSTGDFVPTAAGQLYAGVTFSNTNALARSMAALQKEALDKNVVGWRTARAAEFVKTITGLIEDESGKIEQESRRAAFVASMKKNISANASRPVFLFYTTIKEKEPGDTEQEVAAKRIIKESAFQLYKSFKQWNDSIQLQVTQKKEEYDKLSRFRITIFGFGEKSGLSFKQFVRYDSANLSSSFKNLTVSGGKIGAGINVQWRNLWAGLTYSYVDGNNFKELVPREFVWSRETTTLGQTITEESKITAYKGAFSQVEYNELNADLVYNLRFGDSAKYNVLLNPYVRANLFSRKPDLLTNNITNVGLGMYFFQHRSRLMGGFYLELPDVSNNYAKAANTGDELRPGLRRLSVGVVTKFNISSLFTWL